MQGVATAHYGWLSMEVQKLSRPLIVTLSLIFLAVVMHGIAFAYQMPGGGQTGFPNSLLSTLGTLFVGILIPLLSYFLKVVLDLREKVAKSAADQALTLGEFRTVLLGMQGEEGGGILGKMARIEAFRSSIEAQLTNINGLAKQDEMKIEQLRKDVDELDEAVKGRYNQPSSPRGGN